MRTDIHTHLIPSIAPDLAAVAGLDATEHGLVADGHTIGPPALYRPAQLRDWLRHAGLARALVSVPPPLYRQELRHREAHLWVSGLNDALRADLAGSTRLIPLGYLPLEHPAEALAEATRLIDAATVGFAAAAGGRSRPLDDPELVPLWQLLQDTGRPLLLHPGASPDARLAAHYLHNLLGNPVETTLAAAQMLLGGVLTQFPGLRVALAHCGGVLTAVLGRWQRGVDTHRPGLRLPAHALRAQAQSLWLDSLAHDHRQIDAAIEIVGPEHLLVGSDWPFPMGDSDPLATLRNLGAPMVEQIAVRNAHRFLHGVDRPPPPPLR
ncbi:MAG: amidohydrolase family protein [Beutenbergiaceae bacterium]